METTIIAFDERESTLNHALRTALTAQGEYVFVRLNPHLSSRMDKLLTINFICFGHSLAPSLQTRSLATTTAELIELVSGRVPSLAQLAKRVITKRGLTTDLPRHVVNKLMM